MKLKPVEQQVVVIVGANSGIGRETAMQFAERGAKLVLSGRSQAALEPVAQEIRQKGGEATAIAADVVDFEQVKALADRAVETYGRIDTWVHLAAVTLYARFEDTKPEEFKQVLDTNLLGQIHGALAALPHMKREGSGALIHISSVESRQSLPLQSAYAASKQGMIGFLDALRMELMEEGIPISVTNIKPAGINTPLFSKAKTRLGVKPKPMPPVYEPEVVASMILYAAEHPSRVLYAGGGGKGLGMLQRISPKAAETLMTRIAFSGQKTDQPKSEDAPNNLFNHLEGYDRVHGEFGNQARSISAYSSLRKTPILRIGMMASLLALGAWVAGRAYAKNKSQWMPRIRSTAEKLPFVPSQPKRLALTSKAKRLALMRRRRRVSLPWNGNKSRMPIEIDWSDIGSKLRKTASVWTS